MIPVGTNPLTASVGSTNSKDIKIGISILRDKNNNIDELVEIGISK